jgi:phosphoglycerate dehydrogenase-like enzyme
MDETPDAPQLPPAPPLPDEAGPRLEQPEPVAHWLAGTPVLVLGLGTSGLAMARWCARFGAAVSVWDSREQPPGACCRAASWC